jgi:Tetracyclin repressor-like, C-terminal domain
LDATPPRPGAAGAAQFVVVLDGHPAARHIFWSRLHGVISLELDRHLVSMQLDAELLYRAELAELGGQT